MDNVVRCFFPKKAPPFSVLRHDAACGGMLRHASKPPPTIPKKCAAACCGMLQPWVLTAWCRIFSVLRHDAACGGMLRHASNPPPTIPKKMCSGMLRHASTVGACPLVPHAARGESLWRPYLHKENNKGPLQCGSVLQDIHCPLPTAPCSGYVLKEAHCPMLIVLQRCREAASLASACHSPALYVRSRIAD